MVAIVLVVAARGALRRASRRIDTILDDELNPEGDTAASPGSPYSPGSPGSPGSRLAG